MNGKYFIIGGAVLIIALIAVLSLSNVFGQASPTAKALATKAPTDSSEVQDVQLKVVGGNYILSPSILKKGVKVHMVVDMSTVVGCSRDIVISSFGVRKAVSPGDNIIEFTPDKTGTINIACSMNMYRGTFQVTDDGNPQVGVQAASAPVAPSAGSCGASGGGCGCGA
jgi:plastocyanin domain-containing protein